MELTVFALIALSLWLAFAYRKKSSALRGASSAISISSRQIAELRKMSLHSYWTALAMGVMEERECSFEQAIVLLKIGDAHPDVDWDEVGRIFQDTKSRASVISKEFDELVKGEAESILKNNGPSSGLS